MRAITQDASRPTEKQMHEAGLSCFELPILFAKKIVSVERPTPPGDGMGPPGDGFASAPEVT